MNRLETRRYVVRSPGRRDRRQVIVRLTPSGSSVLRKLSLAHHEELEKAGPMLAQALRLLMKQTRIGPRNTA